MIVRSFLELRFIRAVRLVSASIRAWSVHSRPPCRIADIEIHPIPTTTTFAGGSRIQEDPEAVPILVQPCSPKRADGESTLSWSL